VKFVIYKIFPAHRLMLKLWCGDITNSILFSHEREQFLDPDFPAGPKVIVDVTAAKMIELEGAMFEEFATIYAGHRHLAAGARVAIVASEQFERARKYEAAVAKLGVDVIAFNALSTACTWIGAPFQETAQWFAGARAEMECVKKG
jgi:hypothetical protein